MTHFGRVLTVALAVTASVGTVYAATGGPAAAVTKPAKKPADSVVDTGRRSVSAEYKQINIINIDEGVFEKGRLSQLKGHLNLVLVPRDPKGVPVTIQADEAQFTYAKKATSTMPDKDTANAKKATSTMPDKVIANGNVVIVQGANKFKTDEAVWLRVEGKVHCEGHVEIIYGKSVVYVEQLDHYLADEKTVVLKAKGTIIPPEPPKKTSTTDKSEQGTTP